jgi:guanosine-3',5'-bis(diphosphate) 3'-pyrophosphohydrolase
MSLSENKIKVSSLNARVGKDNMSSITLTLDVINLDQLEHVMIKLRRVRNVYNVQRAATTLGGIG